MIMTEAYSGKKKRKLKKAVTQAPQASLPMHIPVSFCSLPHSDYGPKKLNLMQVQLMEGREKGDTPSTLLK